MFLRSRLVETCTCDINSLTSFNFVPTESLSINFTPRKIWFVLSLLFSEVQIFVLLEMLFWSLRNLLAKLRIFSCLQLNLVHHGITKNRVMGSGITEVASQQVALWEVASQEVASQQVALWEVASQEVESQQLALREVELREVALLRQVVLHAVHLWCISPGGDFTVFSCHCSSHRRSRAPRGALLPAVHSLADAHQVPASGCQQAVPALRLSIG